MRLTIILVSLSLINGSVASAFQQTGNAGNKDKTDAKGKTSIKPSCRKCDVFVCAGAELLVDIADAVTSFSPDYRNCPLRTFPAPENRNCSDSSAKTGALVYLNEGCYFKIGDEFLAPQDFCLNSLSEARVCPDKTVIPKCCNVNEAFDPKVWKCLEVDSSYLPHVTNRNSHTESKNGSIDIGYEEGGVYLSFRTRALNMSLPNIGIKFMKTKWSTMRFEITPDGVYHEPPAILLRGKREKFGGEHCVEQAFLQSMNERSILLYDLAEEFRHRNVAVAIGIIWLFAAPFAIVTAIAHVFVLQRNVHGFSLACYLVTSGLVKILSAVIFFSFNSMTIGESCTFIDIVQKILYASSVCWMTIINFDMWLTFRKLNSLPDGNSLCRFPLYALFSLALPGVIVLFSWIVGERQKPTGIDFCVVYGLPSLISYSIPIFLLIMVNVVLFVTTCLNIRKHRLATEDVVKSSNCVNRKSFTLFAKLFLMTGSFWIIRMILLSLHFAALYLTAYAVILEAIFVTPEILFFFLVFTNGDTWKKFQAKYPALKSYSCCRLVKGTHRGSEGNASTATNSTELSYHRSQSITSNVSVASQDSVECYI